MGVGNDSRYQNSTSFDAFPFPVATDEQKVSIRILGEQLDAHRKARQAAHPTLTMTGMYNVLEKLRAETPLNAKDRVIHEHGLVSVLRQIHDDLDAAVAEAYGWPVDLADEQILERLVALNAERVAEEQRGLVRWLRPDFQAPKEAAKARATQGEMDIAAAPAGKAKKQAWPGALADQVRGVRAALAVQPGPATPADIARVFNRANKTRVQELLETLAALGQARDVGGGRYIP